MIRRKFIRHSILTSIGVNVLVAEACKSPDVPKPTTIAENFILEEITLEDLQRKMKKGPLTSEKITQLYLDRIKEIDSNGYKLNAVIEVNPDAIQIAKALDDERKAGKVRGPLHGVPVLIKDNINTGDKMMTTAGALAMVGNKANHDAFIINLLRQSGAVLLGKTNLSEWANFRSTRSSSGWSSRGGQTKNPYVLDHSPCGSSSGTGSAVAANLCAIGIGTETDGSIACPSSINGLVGIKPTVGLWSRSGIIPISFTQDTAGPMARTVKDAAILLGALCGIDTGDSKSEESKGKSIPDYTKQLATATLQGKRFGVDKSLLKKHEAIDKILGQTIDLMKLKGATIIEVDFMGFNSKVNDPEFIVLKYEFKDGINKYLSNSHHAMKSLDDIIKFNNENKEKAMPFFQQELLEQCAVLGDLNTKEYKLALKNSHEIAKADIDGLLKKDKLDALIGPASGASWCIDKVNGDHFTGYGAYGIAAVAGYPSITVPLGYVHELPVGLSFIGT
ncbi:MAG: amidase, partial [Saprospiraceae bacterium]